VGVHTAGGTTVARTSGGDIYAGHDGNVYKRSDGQWQKYEGGRNWSEVQTPRPYAGAAAGYGTMQSRAQGTPQESWRNNWSSSQWKNNWQSGAFGAGEAQNRWSQHDTQFGLNQDSWARQRGNENAFSSWQGRSGGFGGFGGGFQRGGFGGGGFRGGGFRR
jgi:hypothetical protein